jgi:DNA-binding CsgD family transcriptional regulator
VLWDEESWDVLNARQLALARSAGALARLPIDLTARAILAAWRGDFAEAAAANAETDDVVGLTGTAVAPFGPLLLAALRGREDEVTALAGSAVATGQGIADQYADWTRAVLLNGLGRAEQALDAARRAVAEAPELFLSAWALPELVEAGAMTGDDATARSSVERLTEVAAAAGTDWALGVAARCRGLLEDGSRGEDLFEEALTRLARTRLRPELARTHQLYGEWLRRRGSRLQARAHLRTAHDSFTALGMEGFAERARRELLAAGETVRRRSAPTGGEHLTPQEHQIALLVRDGLSNPEVGARLFLSSRTVEWHLRKIFDKLSISSRRQLRDVLPRDVLPIDAGAGLSRT